METEKLNLEKIHKEWIRDIVNRIELVNIDPKYKEEERITATLWLIKQARQAFRDD